jgi:hypothetical protein
MIHSISKHFSTDYQFLVCYNDEVVFDKKLQSSTNNLNIFFKVVINPDSSSGLVFQVIPVSYHEDGE